MDLKLIISHMNDHHKDEVVALANTYGNLKAKSAELLDLNEDGLKIEAKDGKENVIVNVPFPKKTDPKDYKDAIIKLCQNLNMKSADISKELENFKLEFSSIVLATLNKEKHVSASYAPLINYKGKSYIYISEVSEHYENIKLHPSNIESMFLEDESKAKNPIARKRLRFQTQATFIDRGEFFDEVFDSFVHKEGSGGGIKQIRNMLDFHLVELSFGKGRFVKGFGQAYDILENGDVISLASGGMPHTIKK
ncbi:HugZ family heme oxygenase [Helicobacter sp. 13S00401-1]|uniref:HugZ family heme oxygenase n=1 Tax=Helicobacter sp. 13S00401-1 TaxID=1905758 RepID=UPI000BA61B54|nr:HugZ family heme oxygenase [Helicobacter sp. 13S00401-1]PAF48622.1 HugZ family heme oxygenase [Helicobacter sp. 13S00401-1]